MQTGSKSKLNVRFADGSLLAVESNSSLSLDSLSIYSGGGMVDTKVRLQQGKVEVGANPSQVRGNTMQILTPTAVAAVRGTEFRVSSDDKSFREETLEGQVSLIAGGKEVLVSQGYGSLSQSGKSPLSPVTLLPAPNTSALPTKLTTVPLQFEMTEENAQSVWSGKVYKQVGQHGRILAESVSHEGRLDLGDIPDGQYTLKVRARDSNGLEGYDAKHTFVLDARPFPPQSIFPAESEVLREATPTLSWSKVDLANRYLIELAKDAEFKQVWQSQQVTTTEFTPQHSLEAGQYFWRLASIEGEDVGPYSRLHAFVYKPKPPAPDLSQLSNQIKDNRVFITTLSPPQGLMYEAALDNDMNQQKNVWQGTGLNGQFDFLLREYGKQTLRLRLVDDEGVAGPEAKVEFFAWSPW
ncbi:MAG TPA: FecR domain-containing protein [Methylophilus sp.]